MAATAWLLAATSTAAIAQPGSRFSFDLKSETLSQALRDVALQSGSNIVAPDALIEARRSPALSGTYTVEQAITKLLQGSGLQYRVVGNSLVVEEASFPSPSNATQTATPPSITVTGTRIRGVGSASPVTVATRHDLEQAGISDLADFTRILPQNYTGGQNRGIAGGGEQGGQENLNDSATLNLRGLGPDATLTLLDGHRLSYDAVDQGVDISAIPLGAIDRIEVVSDGASALYGSDAVAGVANIILRRDYEGVETSARVGGSTDGGDFQQQYSIVAGHRWTSGGFMVSFDHSSGAPINAGQRYYSRSLDPSFFLTDRIRQSSGVLSAHQEISPRISFDLDGYSSNRKSLSQDPFLPDSSVLVAGLVTRSNVRSYAITPSLRADLDNWQASLSFTRAKSDTSIDFSNYWNGVATVGRNLFDDTLTGIEATAEGPLFALPGGDARLAFGGGLRSISLHLDETVENGGQTLTSVDSTQRRNVQFAYGELSIPLVRPDLNLALIDRLTLSAALRYEHWDRIAAVTTPKLGLVYQPAPDVIVRATWGRSFKIPTLLQVNEIQEGELIPGFYFTPPPQPAGTSVLLLAGSAPNLKPERAVTWSGTLELKPRFIAGLSLQATYFHIDYRDRVAEPLTSVLSALYNPLYSNFIAYNPSATQVNALVASLPGGLVNETGAPFDPATVGAIIDGSIRNTERQRIHGVDFNGDYHVDLGPGGKLLLTGSASYLESREQLAPNEPTLRLAGTIFNPPHWRGRAGIVWDGQKAGISAFINYVGGTQDNRFQTIETVGPFVTVDLNASFKTRQNAGMLRNIEVRLSALNLFNEKPSLIRTGSLGGAPYDSTNQSPVGRFVGLLIRKDW